MGAAVTSQATHEVLDLLHRRRESQSGPGDRDPSDHDRLAVLVEGGGMRGVISAAALAALEDLQFKSAIDGLIASSAGAMNSAYFASSTDTWYYLSIYFDHLASRQFVNFARPIVGRDILSLEFAFDEVVDRRMPLDLEGVINSPIPVTVALTLVNPPEPLYITEFDSASDLREALVAACWLPIARRGLGTFRGRPALDGGVLTPDLTSVAVGQGYSHVLYLRTRSDPETPTPRLHPFQHLTARHLNRLGEDLGTAYLAARSELRLLPPPHSLATLDIRPDPRGATIKRHEISPGRIIRAARDAYTSMVHTLDPTIQPRNVVLRFDVHR